MAERATEQNEILVVTNPMVAANRSAEVTLSKFLRVIGPWADGVKVIGGSLQVEKDLEEVELISFPIRRHPWKAGRIAAVLQVQLRQMLAVLRLGKRGRPVYFWIADKMLLPYLAARARGMEINYFIYGNVEREGRPSLWTALSGKLIRYMASHADWLCMESPGVRKEWPGLEGKGEKIIHLYTGVNEKPDFSARGLVLGMVCRLTPGKHIIESIRAMAEIHKAYPEWRLEIIGSGIQEPECLALIRQLDAGGYIELQGWVEHARLYSQVKRWKYLLFLTDTEGMPNGLVEMMGQGIPAIASPAGGALRTWSRMEKTECCCRMALWRESGRGWNGES